MSNKRRKYSLEQVEQWLEEAKINKTPIVEVAEKHGVSPGVLYKWRKWIAYRDSQAANNMRPRDAMTARLYALESTVTNLRDTITDLENRMHPQGGSMGQPQSSFAPGFNQMNQMNQQNQLNQHGYSQNNGFPQNNGKIGRAHV